MKILHIGPVYSERASGPSVSILGLAEGQISLGCEVALLSSQPTKLSPKNIPNKLLLLPIPKKQHLNPWEISNTWIKIIMEKFGKPDIINIHDTFIPFQTALANLFKKESWTYIITPRGGLSSLALNIKFFKKKLGRLFFFNRFVKNCEAIHALCANEAKNIQTLYPDKKIFITPNGVTDKLLILSDETEPTKLGNFRKNSDLIIGFIGRIDVYHKGIDLLLSALRLLENKPNLNIKLLMVGPFHTTHDEKQVKSLINSLKFPERVKVIGPSFGQDKWKLLKACDVFVHTSRFEGMPMAVLEAMAFEKPCLVTPGSNMQDIISTCNGGWLCEESVKSISNTIIQIDKIGKKEILIRGLNAKKYAEENLTWPIIARQYLEKVLKI